MLAKGWTANVKPIQQPAISITSAAPVVAAVLMRR